MEFHSTKYLAVVTNAMPETKHLKELLKCMFHNLETEIVIASIGQSKGNKHMAKPTSEKMVVKGQGKTYSEMLKIMKSNIDVESLYFKIENIRKTAERALMFEMKCQIFLKKVLKKSIMNQISKSTRTTYYMLQIFIPQ